MNQEALLSLFNSFAFVEPKLVQFKDLCNGIAILQLLDHFLQLDMSLEGMVEAGNWQIHLKTLKDSWDIMEQRFQSKRKPNFISIAMNQDEVALLDMVKEMIYGLLHSQCSEVFVKSMMKIQQAHQMVIVEMVNELMPKKEEELPKQSDDIVNKLEELEQENSRLNEEIIVMKVNEDQLKQKHSHNTDILQQELDNNLKLITQMQEDLYPLYELAQVQSINDVCEFIHSRTEEIYNMKQIISQQQSDYNQAKEVNDQILKELRNDLELANRKVAQINKLERYAEQLKQQLCDSLKDQNKYLDISKQNQKLKEQLEESLNKCKQLQPKLDQSRQQYKDLHMKQNQYDYDLQKCRSENESLNRQLKLREQETFKLKQEIIDLEAMLHRNEQSQSQIENSSIMILTEQEDKRNISGIFTPKRNLGMELSQLISKSQCFEPHHDKSKVDVHTQSDGFIEQELDTSTNVKVDDQEFFNQQLSFWRSKCSDLVEQVTSQEEHHKLQANDIKQLQQRIESFFNEQNKYETELSSAKELIINYIDDINQKTSIIEQLQCSQKQQAQESKLLQSDYELVSNKLVALEEEIQRKKLRAVRTPAQVITKQLEITKRQLEEANESKAQELQLLSGVLVDKKFLGTATRYLFIFAEYVVINKEHNKKKADRVFYVAQTKRIVWKYSQEKQSRLKSFSLDYGDQYYEYMGDESVLQELKKHFAKMFFQARVQDEYVALQVIGQGNYALVLELKHLHSQKKFASKCIDKKKLETIENGMDSVVNEIKIMRILSPNEKVINLHEVYEGDNNIYLVMDLAEGGSLYSEMKHRQNLYHRQDVQKIMTSILEALHYMHTKNIMHRDLKPENILFTEKNDISSLRIADFGLAAISDQYPYLYPKCGTPGFVAPEIANLIDKSTQYNSKCDVFSAGVIFHILLLGEGLFNGNGHVEILKQNKICEINCGNKKYLRIDSDCRDLLFKMIEKDPSKRLTAAQCLDHPFFFNENPPLVMLKQSSLNSPVKDNFVQYLQNNNSPDVQLMRKNSTRLSIVTRTPIYAPKGSQPDLGAQHFVWDEISSFSLDQLKGEELNGMEQQYQQQFAK